MQFVAVERSEAGVKGDWGEVWIELSGRGSGLPNWSGNIPFVQGVHG